MEKKRSQTVREKIDEQEEKLYLTLTSIQHENRHSSENPYRIWARELIKAGYTRSESSDLERIKAHCIKLSEKYGEERCDYCDLFTHICHEDESPNNWDVPAIIKTIEGGKG
jgi:cyclopropane fatty-acyl-phospholipid synthase-like methyltransferase